MNGFTFLRLVDKYKECPKCGAGEKGEKLKFSLDKNDIIWFYSSFLVTRYLYKICILCNIMGLKIGA